MSKQATDRFDDVIDFLTAMGGRRPRLSPPNHRGTTTTAPIAKAHRPRRWHRVPLAAAALVVVGALAAVGLGRDQTLGTADPTGAAPAAVAPPVRDPAPVPMPGRLFISSEPWGRLSIDGTSVGRTPAIDLPIASGVHVLRIERDGYQTFEREVRVDPGAEVRLTGLRLLVK